MGEARTHRVKQMGTQESAATLAGQAKGSRGSSRERISAGTPEDVAALYAWANLQGARYWDFSASRREYRQQVRARAAEAIRQRREAEESERRIIAGLQPAFPVPPRARVASPSWGSRSISILPVAGPAVEEPQLPQFLQTNRTPIADGFVEVSREIGKHDATLLWDPAPVRVPQPPAEEDAGESWKASLFDDTFREFLAGDDGIRDGHLRYSGVEQVDDSQESGDARAEERAELSPQLSAHEADTVQDRMIFRESQPAPAPAWISQQPSFDLSSDAPPPFPPRGARAAAVSGSAWSPLLSGEVGLISQSGREHATLLLIFSIEGQTGRTSLLANLGRALASLGERVVLGDAGPCSPLPLYFGAREVRSGMARAYAPPDHSADPPVFVVNYPLPETVNELAERRHIMSQILRNGAGAHRILLDLPLGAEWLIRRVATLQPVVLVPLKLDRGTMAAVESVERFFATVVDFEGEPLRPYYLLNQFDSSLPLHMDVRTILDARLGERLLSAILHQSPLIEQALAEGMTVIDYALDSTPANDVFQVAAWLRTVAPATLHAAARWGVR